MSAELRHVYRIDTGQAKARLRFARNVAFLLARLRCPERAVFAIYRLLSARARRSLRYTVSRAA